MTPFEMDRRYMVRAQAIATDPELRICPSRQIGVVIVDTDSAYHSEISSGYNGPPRGVPHNDSKQWLNHLLTVLDDKQLDCLCDSVGADKNAPRGRESLDKKYVGCGQCPRRLLKCPSGEQLHLCSCAHAERNAIANAALGGRSVRGCTMYCWCGVPCHECSTVIINSGISRVVCLREEKDYSPSSRALFSLSGLVELVEYSEEELCE